VVAHADDSILFMNPDLLELIRNGGAIESVFTTVGDDGLGLAYAGDREQGALAAIAYMAGAANTWSEKTVSYDGHGLTTDILTTDPKMTAVFMRLPDGSTDGSGWADTSYQSLKKLWTGSISTIGTLDRTGSYTKQSLTDTLAAMITSYHPNVIWTQDYRGQYENGDHSDHTTTAYFTVAARAQYRGTPPRLVGFMGYPIGKLPANVSGALESAKEDTFVVYSQHDSHGCPELSECTHGFLGATVNKWFARQYIAGVIPKGIRSP
jgi:LmbE family N-acetylglucosaminyl deacetylase